jgi:hypothetical protein
MRLPDRDQVIALRLADEPARIDLHGLAFDSGEMDDAIAQLEAAGGPPRRARRAGAGDAVRLRGGPGQQCAAGAVTATLMAGGGREG